MRILPAFLLLPAFLCLGFTTLAQKLTPKEREGHARMRAFSKDNNTVAVSLDTILNAGQSYGVIKKDKCDLQCSFSVRTLKGEEVLFVEKSMDGKGTLYKFFLDTLLVVPVREVVINEKSVAKMVAQNDLLTPTGINRDKVARFRQKYRPYVIMPAPDHGTGQMAPAGPASAATPQPAPAASPAPAKP